MSAFALADGAVYHTYSTYARGLEFLMGYYPILDRAPKGRDEKVFRVLDPATRRVRGRLSSTLPSALSPFGRKERQLLSGGVLKGRPRTPSLARASSTGRE